MPEGEKPRRQQGPDHDHPRHDGSDSAVSTPHGGLSIDESTIQEHGPVHWPWRPFYLRRRILLSFASILALIVISLQVLLAVSKRNDGLVSARDVNRHYIWKYSPTAVLTLLAATWSRAEYQSKLVAPWLRLAGPRPASPEKTLLLDYLSDFQICAVFRAFRNRDYTVSIASAVGIVIKAIIVISSGLLSFRHIQVHHDSYPLTLADRFVDSNFLLSQNSTMSYHVMEGLANWNLTPPDGISRAYAVPSLATAGIPGDAETRVTVDGFEGSLELVRNATQILSVTPVFGARERTLESVHPWDIMRAHFAAFLYSISGDATTVPVKTANTEITLDTDASMMAITRYLQAGHPSSSLFQPEVLRGLVTDLYRQHVAILAKQTLMEPVSVETRGSLVTWDERLVIRPWAAHWMAGLATACALLVSVAIFLVPKHGILPCSPSTLSGMASLVVDSPGLLAALRFSGAADHSSLKRHLLSSTFRSQALVDPASSRWRFGIVQEQCPSDARRQPPLPPQDVKNTHPWVLHPATRGALCVFLIAIMVTFEVTLRISEQSDGLGDAPDDSYTHYTWAEIPAMVTGAVAIMLSSMDFQIRSLAPYKALARSVPAKTFFSMDLMDTALPRTIWRELRLANIGALSTTVAFLIASVFTIFSSALFQAVVIPTEIRLTLKVNQSFSSGRRMDAVFHEDVVASLIFQSNFSFLPHTYEDLAFPHLITADSLDFSTGASASTLLINATVPALRAQLQCRFYDASMITVSYREKMLPSEGRVPVIGIKIQGEEPLGVSVNTSSGEMDPWNHVFYPTIDMTYFGLSEMDTINSTYLYAWGRIDYTADPMVQHIVAAGCNETFETLSVSTHFQGTQLSLDPRHRPHPLEDSARPSTLAPTTPTHYQLARLPTSPDNLTPFFGMLTSSPWAIPRSSLGDPSAVADVLAAIKKHHGIIWAQQAAAAAQLRVPASKTNATLPPEVLAADPDATDDMPGYAADATTPPGEGQVERAFQEL
ncbi:hypothetical protein VTJ49DRAFT_6955 [Mycothermus thermophilus]|uniref:Uncharacterized protein n=1 Tax=Humicola insolens TaxID=85995 RepID=A0ABR3VJ49_HUMIN